MTKSWEAARVAWTTPARLRVNFPPDLAAAPGPPSAGSGADARSVGASGLSSLLPEPLSLRLRFLTLQHTGAVGFSLSLEGVSLTFVPADAAGPLYLSIGVDYFRGDF